jgi:tripartite-type tricarboxylate transporter receptor subunit TctC
MRPMTRRQVLAATAFAPWIATRAKATGYPDRSIRVVIPQAAGGLPDMIMRLFAVSMEPRLGQKLIVESKPGGAGNIGTQEVARAAPDGSTILVAATNNFIINQFMMKLPFDPITSLAPIAKLAEVPLVLFSNPKVPARTMREFIDYARANPAKISYGVPGLGTVNHLMMERLKQVTGASITCVPYRGSAAPTLALLQNDIQLFPIGLGVLQSHLKEGKVTALAVATEKRIAMLPDVPTVAESGFPGFVASNWFGMAAPGGTPDDILDILAAAVADAQNTALVQDRFKTLGMLIPELSRSQFAATLKADAEMWRETVERGKITLE